MCAAQSSFTQVLLKDECTCINAFTVIILGQTEAILAWDSLIEQKRIEKYKKKDLVNVFARPKKTSITVTSYIYLTYFLKFLS